MKVFHARTEGAPSELRSATFTGTVWGDPIMPTTDNVTINNVFFALGGRTHWHTHELGQVLDVVAGSGRVTVHMPRTNKVTVMIFKPLAVNRNAGGIGR